MTQAESPVDVTSPKTSFAGIGRRNLLLGAAVVALGAAALWQTKTVNFADGNDLSVTDAHRQAQDNGVTLIDIRTPEEWRETGIGEGAHALDMRREDFLAELQRIAGPDKSAPVALICATGVRSAWMSKKLKDAGYENVLDVSEGMQGSVSGPGWIALDLPVRPYVGDAG